MEWLSSCFICGGNCSDSGSPPGFGGGSRSRRKVKVNCNFEKLKGLVKRLCEVLNVEVTEEDWEYLEDLEEEQKRSICCGSCYEMLGNVENIHEIIVRAQEQLKCYLRQVESLIVKSGQTQGLHCSLWWQGCFRLRRSILSKNATNSLNISSPPIIIRPLTQFSGSQVKKEPENVHALLAPDFDDHDWADPLRLDDDVLDSYQDEPSLRTVSTSVGIGAVGDAVNLGDPNNFPVKIETADANDSSPKRRGRKRKIAVVADEDVVMEETPKKLGRPRKAKISAVEALTNQILIDDDNDEDCNEEFIAGAVEDSEYLPLESEQRDYNEDEEPSSSSAKSPKRKTKDTIPFDSFKPPRGRGRPKSGRKSINLLGCKKSGFDPFLEADENLYLYRWDTFVRYTYTHLQCMAYQCTFQVEFDRYPSFQIMKAHLEEFHRDRVHRQKRPHPCVLCNILLKNREDLSKHISDHHNEKLGTTARTVCECCLATHRKSYAAYHLFQHKSKEEQEAHIKSGGYVPARALVAINQKNANIEKELYANNPDQVSNVKIMENEEDQEEDSDHEGNTQVGCKNTGFHPFLVAGEDLYLYRWNTYIQYKYSHLKCLAYNCTFETRFDFYPSFQLMKQHLEENHRDKDRQETPHPCVPCNILFKNRQELIDHLGSTHYSKIGGNDRRVLCECCLTNSSSKYAERHLMSHKSDEEMNANRKLKGYFNPKPQKWFYCTVENCNKKFIDPKNFRRHTYSHLPMSERPDATICPECGKYILKEVLNRHMQKAHHPETVDRVIICNLCDKRFMFGDRCSFKAHMRRHKGERPFLCPQCGQSYLTKGGLNFHIREVHNESQEPIYCEFCDCVYTKRQSLRAHMATKHPEKCKHKGRKKGSKFYWEEVVDPKELYGPVQMFPCTKCDVLCKYKYTLAKHLANIHGIGDATVKRPLSLYRRKKEEQPEEGKGDNYDDNYV